MRSFEFSVAAVEWEKFIAAPALSETTVIGSRQIKSPLVGCLAKRLLSERGVESIIPNSVYLLCKGLLDKLIVLVVMPGLIPVAFIVALLIKLDDGGAIFFTQERVGFRGRIFRIFKFRTMRTSSQEDPYFTKKDDPRVTRVGLLLRRYRIDEMPQAINVLRGEMSWIGPRPESLPLSRWYRSKIPFYSYRHIVLPGITGWAQVRQGWAAAQIEDVTAKLHFDFYYIKHFSPWLDLLIVARTIHTVVTGRGAK